MSDDEIKLLLDSLERMSKIYSYIPEEKQKEIILTQLIADREYQNINVRTVSKWLDLNGKTYFKEEAHKTHAEHPPATPDQRAQRLKEWEQMLSKTAEGFTALEPKRTGSRMREHFDAVAPIPPEESALNEYCKTQQETLKTNTEETNLE